MQIDVTLKNYRCFQDSHPASIRLQPGFVALLGTNNSGKSTLLKFFYEFRKLFEIAQDGQTFAKALGDQAQVFSFQTGITDSAELFCNANDRNIQILVRVSPFGHEATTDHRWPDQ